jgi:hypothetical protein
MRPSPPRGSRPALTIFCVATLVAPAIAFSQSVTFTRATLAVPGAPRAVASADFNGDGRVDLAAATMNADAGGGGAIAILSNDGAAFRLRRTLRTQAGPFAITAGDFNNDGAPDLAVVDADAYVVEVFAHEAGTAFDFVLLSTYTTLR